MLLRTRRWEVVVRSYTPELKQNFIHELVTPSRVVKITHSFAHSNSERADKKPCIEHLIARGKSSPQRSAESRGFSPGSPVSSHRES